MNSNVGMFRHWKNDSIAGLVVFLVALPLCLGIALASGVSAFSGIIAGVIGGIVIGGLSKSSLSVSGPAAGLVIIVLNAVKDLGTFEAFLLAVLFAGILQILMGLLRIGIIGSFFPSSVIRGMLAAIGIILILKQLPHLVGFDSDAFGEMEFFQTDGDNTITALFSALTHIHTGSLIVGLFSIALLIFWGSKTMKGTALSKIPGGLVAVALGAAINALFMAFAPGLTIESSHLVELPVLNAESSLGDIFTSPDWNAWKNPKVYLVAATLALIASLETLLSLEAIDKLDPEKRQTPQNRELIAQGAGNILSGLLGGLPITAVIVRSSANLDAGAKTKLAAIIHGLILAFSVMLIPGVLNLIPLSALAAILIIVGFKLTKPSLFREIYRQGLRQIIPFIVTIVAILFTDLLIGILIGLAVGAFNILLANYLVSFQASSQKGALGNAFVLRLSEHMSILNKPSLLRAFREIPEGTKVIIDAADTHFIDYDVLEVIHNFKETASARNISVRLINIPDLETPSSSH